ncbi:lipoprotein [Streptomyces sp. NPDC013313]|uniref:lipoprotein n=1 Tax=Streptomyces sp. NPDC013313 TaxID=3155603 RepID=UPI0033CA5B76
MTGEGTVQVKVGIVRGGTVGLTAGSALLAAVLSGCTESSTAQDGGEPSRPAKSAASAATAAGGGTVGAAGSACELPVSFDVAEHWKAKGVDAGAELSKASKGADGSLTGDLADALLRQGPVTAACEIDAKPAGNIGFLRVWTGKPGDTDARTVLREFVAAEDNAGEAEYHSFRTASGVPGVEVEYLYTSKLLDETKKETALAVSTPDGPVVLHLGGMDTEEHEQMRPAWELAKRTLRVR